MEEPAPVILLVEDNPDDVALTKRAFKKNNIANEIVVARDGEEALEWLFCSGEHADRDPKVMPQIVLLDLKMPKVNGIEVLERIRGEEETRLLPVIVLTTSLEDQDLTKAYELRCNSYIRKPVDFDQFIEAVQQLGLYWLVLNQLPPSKG